MKKTIVCFGDSNTHGYNALTNSRFDETVRWPMRLQALLGDDYLICEEGLSGRTTVFDDPIHEGLRGLSAIYPCLMTHEPVDLLVIMLGTNDVKERFGTPATLIADGLLRLLRHAQTAPAFRNNQPNILVLSPPHMLDSYQQSAPAMGAGCADKSRALPSLLEERAKMVGCHFLRAGDFSQMHPADGMHLGEEGHLSLAAALAEHIPAMI